MLGVGTSNWGFRLLGAGAGRGWMARRGGREAVALNPQGGTFLSLLVEGPAQEQREAPPTPNTLSTILRDMGHKNPLALY
jgi:hypothetical protein